MRPSHDDVLSAIFAQPNTDGSFPPDHLRTLQLLGAKRKVVLLAFPPKAGGTFLRAAVIKAVGGQLVRIVHAQGGRDATPYLPALVEYFEGRMTEKVLVTHVHMLALPANLHLLAAFGIKPAIMVRSIPDMLASYWDMLESDDEALHNGLNCLIPFNFRDLPRNAKADFLIDILAPWYVNYYASWFEHALAVPGAVHALDFRVFQRDPAQVVASCLSNTGLPHDLEACEAAVAHAWKQRQKLRFNKGKSGRGEHYFRPSHLHRLARMLGHYRLLAPHVGVLLATGKAAESEP